MKQFGTKNGEFIADFMQIDFDQAVYFSTALHLQ
jgi:hypothetical protein